MIDSPYRARNDTQQHLFDVLRNMQLSVSDGFSNTVHMALRKRLMRHITAQLWDHVHNEIDNQFKHYTSNHTGVAITQSTSNINLGTAFADTFQITWLQRNELNTATLMGTKEIIRKKLHGVIWLPLAATVQQQLDVSLELLLEGAVHAACSD
jgi:hypothetical protein